jgi:hypothetical protein
MQTYRDSNVLMEDVMHYMDTLMEYTRDANTLHHRSYDGSEHEGSKDYISGLRSPGTAGVLLLRSSDLMEYEYVALLHVHARHGPHMIWVFTTSVYSLPWSAAGLML